MHEGVGMMFPTAYRGLVEAIKKGKYGRDWQKLMASRDDVAVNAERRLYLCPICGQWEMIYDLSLYIPKKGKGGEKKPAQVKQKDYVLPLELTSQWESSYELLKHYKHQCPTCKATMVPVDMDDLLGASFKCPECGHPNQIKSVVMWD